MRRMMLGLVLLAACSAQLGGRNNRSGAAQVNAQNNQRGRAVDSIADALEPGTYPVKLEVRGSDGEPAAGVLVRVEDVDEVRTSFPRTGEDGITQTDLRYGEATKLPKWEYISQAARTWSKLEVGVFRAMDNDGFRVVVRVPGAVEDRHVLGDMQQANVPPAPPPVVNVAPPVSNLPTPGPPMIWERRVESTCWVNPSGTAFHRFENCAFVRGNARAMPCDEAAIEASEHRLCRTCAKRWP